MLWMRCPASCTGNFTRQTWCTLLRPSPPGFCSSEVGTVISIALDARTGKEKWRFKTGEDHQIYNQVGIQSSAAVMDGVVYFGCRDSNYYALDARTGEKKWVFNNKGSWVISSPAVQDGKVYFATSDSGLFYELDARLARKYFH
jgi:outer membrane protein assembly factor BamB